jgi:hypothetical protein
MASGSPLRPVSACLHAFRQVNPELLEEELQAAKQQADQVGPGCGASAARLAWGGVAARQLGTAAAAVASTPPLPTQLLLLCCCEGSVCRRS